MVIEFNCGNCGKQLKTDESRAGQRGKCPDCGEPIVVPAAAGSGDFAPDEFDFDATPAPPPPRSGVAGATVTCPMCGAQVAAGASRCDSCGESLKSDLPGDREFSTGNKIASGDVVSHAWKAFNQQMGIAIGGTVVFGVFIILNNLLGQGIQRAAGVEFDALGGPVFIPGQVNWGMYIGGLILTGLIGIWLNLGLIRFTLPIVRGEQTNIGLLFSGTPYMLRAIIAMIIIFMAFFGLAFVISFIGGLLGAAVGPAAAGLIFIIMLIVLIPLGLSIFWVQYLIVDQDLPAMKSIETSRELMKGNKLTLFVLLIFGAILLFLGALLLLIGLFFTAPLFFLILAAAYEQLTGGRYRTFEG